MKALLHLLGACRTWGMLAIAAGLASCTNAPHPRREAPSPVAPQWQALHHHPL